MIELGVIHRIEPDGRLRSLEPQQEPHLFLADTPRRGALPLVTERQAVTQPACGAPDKLDVIHPQAHFLMQFAVKRFFRGLAEVYSALRELPAAVTAAAGPQHIAVVVGHDDAHIGPEPVGIDGFGNSFHGAHNSRFHYPAVYGITAGVLSGASP